MFRHRLLPLGMGILMFSILLAPAALASVPRVILAEDFDATW